LKEHGRIASEDPNTASWIKRVFVADDPLSRITADVPAASTPACFAERLRHGCLHERKKAMAVLARLKGIRLHAVAESLDLTPNTVIRYMATFAGGGVDALFRARQSKVHDEEHQGPVFALLHSPPSSYGINRTTWRMEDLHNVLAQAGHRISESRIRRIIKAGGFRWRKAKTVLTSNDPQYQSKLEAIQAILSELKPDEAFFSIDDYGPFAVKQKGGRKRVGPGEKYVVQQWQKSKGWMILTAALELSRNQVTHFYSLKKNTAEMIKMADLLRQQYRGCRSIYLSWDAASWHISKKLIAHLKTANKEAVRDGSPLVWTAPLPAGAQFLNVIESVFSGMSRAIIHNSDYASLDAARDAIDLYFRERNEHFSEHTKRAGVKIWGKERVPSKFQEGQNCKDPAYR
jgi:transposase